MARIRPKPEEFEYDIENLKTGTEYTVKVLFIFTRGYPATRLDPECPAEVEIVGVEHIAGGRDEIEWEMDREMITAAIMEEGGTHDDVVQEIFDHIAGEEERRCESETEYEAMVDSAIAQSYDETH